MGAERARPGRRVEATRIATGLLLEFGDEEIPETGPGELPSGRQSADAATDDEHRHAADFVRNRHLAAAQAMSELKIGAEQAAGRRPLRQRLRAGRQQRAARHGTGHTEKISAVHQRITCRHSRSK